MSNSFEILPWHQDFETGLDSIDAQHRVLVGILNRLASHLVSDASPDVLGDVFSELMSYADYHFVSEETVWERYLAGSPLCLSHQASHESFIRHVAQVRQQDDGKPTAQTIQELVIYLIKWLVSHILESDKRMVGAVLQIQKGSSLQQALAQTHEVAQNSKQVLINAVLRMYEQQSLSSLGLMRERTRRERAESELKNSEARWRYILDEDDETIWDWNIQDRVTSTSGARVEFLDVLQRDARDKDTGHALHPDDVEQMRLDLQAHLDGVTDFYVNKHRVMQVDGSWSWVLIRGKVVSRDEQNRPLRMIGTRSDVTEHELAALIFRQSSQAMAVTDQNGDIIRINPAFSKITGYGPSQVIGKDPRMLLAGKSGNRIATQIRRTIEKEGSWRGELCQVRRNGERYYVSMSINKVVDDFGRTLNYIGLFNDITEKKKSEEIIHRQANFDPLTQLPNRRLCQDMLDKEIKRARRSGLPFALLFIDLDHFKDVNDTFSHDVGDMLLIQAGRRMASCVREEDCIARLGGDEFTIIIPDLAQPSDIDRIANTLIDTLSQPFDLDGHWVFISASIGITLYPSDADTVSGLLRNADQAMYLAKESGRGQFCYFTREMQEQAMSRRQLMTDLRQALELEQFQVFYQPVVDLKLNRIVKAEGLIRWLHPEKGLIAPDQFIPLAEAGGLIIKIGQWVTLEAARQALIWRERVDPGFQVSVNRSPIEFREKGNLESWFRELRGAGVPLESVIIEITENLLMEEKPDTQTQLLSLRDAGVEVALDDFGTGYSSLSYIRDFDIDYIKIDRTFVDNLTSSSQAYDLCDAIIGMAHKLGISVVAEGIESREQLELLKGMGCDFGQGYLFSKPVSASDFDSLFQEDALVN